MEYNIYTPSVTIFNDDMTIDYEGNKRVIEYLIEGGVNGICPLGSTGEFTDMSIAEKKEIIDLYVKEVDGRCELIPGTGGNTFEETVDLSNHALKQGVKGVLVVGPYYYGVSQEDIFNYYNELAKRLDGNIYIYNFPARTGYDISAETTYRLLENNENIVGMKDSNTLLGHTKDILKTVLDDFPHFEMFSGYDDHFIPNIMGGGVGCIAALSNISPQLWAKWIKAANDKDFDELRNIGIKMDKLMRLYEMDSNFSYLFKSIMKENGLDINTKSLFPFDGISDEKLEESLELVKEVIK